LGPRINSLNARDFNEPRRKTLVHTCDHLRWALREGRLISHGGLAWRDIFGTPPVPESITIERTERVYIYCNWQQCCVQVAAWYDYTMHTKDIPRCSKSSTFLHCSSECTLSEPTKAGNPAFLRSYSKQHLTFYSHWFNTAAARPEELHKR